MSDKLSVRKFVKSLEAPPVGMVWLSEPMMFETGLVAVPSQGRSGLSVNSPAASPPLFPT